MEIFEGCFEPKPRWSLGVLERKEQGRRGVLEQEQSSRSIAGGMERLVLEFQWPFRIRGLGEIKDSIYGTLVSGLVWASILGLFPFRWSVLMEDCVDGFGEKRCIG